MASKLCEVVIVFVVNLGVATYEEECLLLITLVVDHLSVCCFPLAS